MLPPGQWESRSIVLTMLHAEAFCQTLEHSAPCMTCHATFLTLKLCHHEAKDGTVSEFQTSLVQRYWIGLGLDSLDWTGLDWISSVECSHRLMGIPWDPCEVSEYMTDAYPLGIAERCWCVACNEVCGLTACLLFDLLLCNSSTKW